MRPEVAQQRIESFVKCFGDAHLHLAYHAAFPLALTPDLLYRVWVNFMQDIHGQALETPWIAVADLLLSSLCDEVGQELYEMDGVVRNELLSQLKEDERFGEERINELSKFLLAYIEQELSSHDLDVQDFVEVQKWTALAYVQPSEAARELALALKEVYREDGKDRTELVRVASVVETFAEPLVGFEPLLYYARGMSKFVRDDLEGAIAEFDKASGGDLQIQVMGVSLDIPELRTKLSNIPVNKSRTKLVQSERYYQSATIGQKPSKKLYNRDVYILIDQSGSMVRTDAETGNIKRWERLLEVLEAHIYMLFSTTSMEGQKICDEVILTFFSPNRESDTWTYVADTAQLPSVFLEHKPDSSTFIVPTLKKIIDHWFAQRSNNNGGFIIIYTDGMFDDRDRFLNLIAATCSQLKSQDELKIIIIAIGSDIDPRFYLQLDRNIMEFRDSRGLNCNIVVFDWLDKMPNIIEILNRQLENPEGSFPIWAREEYPELFA